MNNLPAYRACHKANKTMHEVQLIDFDQDILFLYPNSPMFNDGDEEPVVCNFKEIILMQSTGLKDKNGVMIFKDDIFMWRGFIGSVKQEECGNWVFVSPRDGAFGLMPCNKEGEIIGSIHTHPHLLQGERE